MLKAIFRNNKQQVNGFWEIGMPLPLKILTQGMLQEYLDTFVNSQICATFDSTAGGNGTITSPPLRLGDTQKGKADGAGKIEVRDRIEPLWKF
jgi:hypothetical protein